MSFLLPLVGSLFSGLLNSGQQSAASAAGAQAAQGQTQVAQAESDMINTLLAQFQNTFQPLQNTVAGQYAQAAQAPTSAVMDYVVAQLLNPNAYRQDMTNSVIQGLVQQAANLKNMGLDESQLAGAAQGLGEQAFQGLAQGNIQANLQQDTRNQQAMQMLSSMLGGAGQFSGLGMDITGQAQQGLSGLGNMYGTAAANAGNALASMGNPWSGLTQTLQNWATQNPQGSTTGEPGISFGGQDITPLAPPSVTGQYTA